VLLTIRERAAGRDPIVTLRINNLVLAAPDLDLAVTLQRVAAERVSASVRRMTIYTSPHDKAISLSEFLFGGLARIGQLNFLELQEKADLPPSRPDTNAAFIEYAGPRGGAHGHSYFRENPAVASDVVLVMRYDRGPGAHDGRPLRHMEGAFWAIDDDYLSGRARAP